MKNVKKIISVGLFLLMLTSCIFVFMPTGASAAEGVNTTINVAPVMTLSLTGVVDTVSVNESYNISALPVGTYDYGNNHSVTIRSNRDWHITVELTKLLTKTSTGETIPRANYLWNQGVAVNNPVQFGRVDTIGGTADTVAFGSNTPNGGNTYPISLRLINDKITYTNGSYKTIIVYTAVAGI